jgi:hypothetical protein
MKRLSALGIIAATALFCSAPLSLDWSPTTTPSLSVDTASARIGHPLTPMSVAGVYRLDAPDSECGQRRFELSLLIFGASALS